VKSVAFTHPVPLIAHMRKPLLLIAHAGAGACTPRTGRVSPPTRCPTPLIAIKGPVLNDEGSGGRPPGPLLGQTDPAER
jgi:hypothetical protein